MITLYDEPGGIFLQQNRLERGVYENLTMVYYPKIKGGNA